MSVLPKVHIGSIRAYIEASQKQSVNIQPILARVSISEHILQNGIAKVPLTDMVEFQKKMREVCRNPFLDLTAGRDHASGTFGAFQYLMQSRPTIRDAVTDIIRYAYLISEYATYSLTEEGNCARFAKHLQVPSELIAEETASFCFAAVLGSTRRILGRNWFPLQVRLTRKKPYSTQAYEECFGCEVLFGCTQDEMIIPKAILDQKSLTADPILAQALDSFLSSFTEPNLGASIKEQVCNILQKKLGRGNISLPFIARELNLSTRSLQRYLTKERTSYKAILREARMNFALIQLGNAPKVSIEQIAESLGFSNRSSFDRAFKHWSGKNPKALRSKK